MLVSLGTKVEPEDVDMAYVVSDASLVVQEGTVGCRSHSESITNTATLIEDVEGASTVESSGNDIL